jgi:hypothetical protein
MVWWPCLKMPARVSGWSVLIDAVSGEQVDPSTALQNVEAYHAWGCSGRATGG